MKNDKVTSDCIDIIASMPLKFRLRYNNKNLTIKQKRVIRQAFNKIQPALISKIGEEFHNLMCYGTKISRK